MAEEAKNQKKQRYFEISDFCGNSVKVAAELGLYDVYDFVGRKMPGIAIILNEYSDDNEFLGPYATLTVSFGEFIGMKNCAYIDTNNCPFAEQILKDVAENTFLTRRSGYCEYPAWVFNKDFLEEIGPVNYQIYSDAYDEYMSNILDGSDDEDFEETQTNEINGMGGIV